MDADDNESTSDGALDGKASASDQGNVEEADGWQLVDASGGSSPGGPSSSTTSAEQELQLYARLVASRSSLLSDLSDFSF